MECLRAFCSAGSQEELMSIIDCNQTYHILQNLSSLELSFMEYSSHFKNFVEYRTYLSYMNNVAIRKHDLWRFYFSLPLNHSDKNTTPVIPNVVYSNISIPNETPFSIGKTFNFPNGPLHQCDYYTMLYNFEGLAHVTIGDQKHTLSPGDIYIIPPMVPYALDAEPESICLFLDLKTAYMHSRYPVLFQGNQQLIQFLANYISTNDSTGFVSIHIDNNPNIKTASLQILTEYINHEKYYQSAMENYLSLFFTFMLRCDTMTIHTSVSATKTQQNYKVILDYIRNNYQTTNLEDISEQIHFSKQYICRIVKDATGDTFANVLLAERLKVACNLLLDSKAPLEEISDLCGFSTASYFSRIFKQMYGVTPSAYRREHQVQNI